MLIPLLIFVLGVEPPAIDWKKHDVGLIRLKISNLGTMGKHQAEVYGQGRPHCEYPPGSSEEHICGAGLWIGAKVDGEPRVTQAFHDWAEGGSDMFEFYPTNDPNDTIWVASINDLDTLHGVRGVDDDGDGKVDEELLDGRDNDQDGFIDEDYATYSEQDFTCHYCDDYWTDIVAHKPLHLEVIQRSWAWGRPPYDEFVFVDYQVVNKNEEPYPELYLGFWFDFNIGIYPTWGWWDGDYSWFDEDLLVSESDTITTYTMYAFSLPDPSGTPEGAVAVSILKYPKEPGLRAYRWYMDCGEPYNDSIRYEHLSQPIVMESQGPDQASGGSGNLISFGPYYFAPGDTLRLTIVVVCGMGPEGVEKNVKTAHAFYANDFHGPAPPPSPPLKVYPDEHKVTLCWRWEPGDPGVNPEEFHDPYRVDGIECPFAGYRVYKSTSGINGPWTLMADFDKKGDGFGRETGLQYEYVDSGLVNGIPYWYCVTSYAIPHEGVWLESAKFANMQKVVPGSPPKKLGRVAVVPNPYLGNVDYTSPLPWETPREAGRQWSEADRRVQFVNLPAHCTIRIYTLSGDLVDVIEHNDPNKGYEDWYLVSRANQAITTEIYIFSVEDHETGEVQIGKFVVIK